MAELNISNNKRRKKYFHKHVRVDLTSMVDLGPINIVSLLMGKDMCMIFSQSNVEACELSDGGISLYLPTYGKFPPNTDL